MSNPGDTQSDQSAPSNNNTIVADNYHPEEVVQVVYQSDQHGSMVGVESSLIHGSQSGQERNDIGPCSDEDLLTDLNQQLSRTASTLPSVAEESTLNSGPVNCNFQTSAEPQPDHHLGDGKNLTYIDEGQTLGGRFSADTMEGLNNETHHSLTDAGVYPSEQAFPIYSTVNKQAHQQQSSDHYPDQATSFYSNSNQPRGETEHQHQQLYQQPIHGDKLIDYANEGANNNDGQQEAIYDDENKEPLDEASKINQEVSELISRQKGAVERGSFRHNFRKKLGLSVSTNENELTTFRQRLLDESSAITAASSALATKSLVGDNNSRRTKGGGEAHGEGGTGDELEHKFKRTHSVSFNIHSARSNRLSVDIRNLPSYLTHKRASIVDVAKGAMSSLISSLGGGSGTASNISDRRDSSLTNPMDDYDDEPIFEEPIAPTLSLGQRVALVRSGGSEFGTVGWIGQLPEVEDDWIVGVIFDNMIGNCDGAFNGVRYFYARQNYAMFVPLSVLTKTDNYIGRPETGTMLSRMSIALKPGQLISIQRSSIRLQHCFLNAPHQRVGHDVRAVSNRLHCQCHNCGPCAHLTKQGRVAAMPHFGSHHLPYRKKNSLAHAAVELLAHHHHHFHEEEEDHEEKDHQFGDNAAHACNFVRYSCCQQNGVNGHEFSGDCRMVRPELLDNLIHAPKAPHRRSRPRRRARRNDRKAREALEVQQQLMQQLGGMESMAYHPLTADDTQQMQATSDTTHDGPNTNTMSSVAKTTHTSTGEPNSGSASRSLSRSSYSSSGSSRSVSTASRVSSCAADLEQAQQQQHNYYTYDSTTTYRPTSGGSGTAGGVYNTIDSHISFIDQRRFIYQRDSSALIHTGPAPRRRGSPSSDDYFDGSELSGAGGSLGLGRLLRCFGCGNSNQGRQRGRGRRNERRGSGRSSMSSGSRRKLTAKDKVLEYRRRQSTFVPSTLAKPQDDLATHGIILPKASRSGAGGGRAGDAAGCNSDYSSYSNSSSCSSSPRSRPNAGAGAASVEAPVGSENFANKYQQSVGDYGLKSSGGHESCQAIATSERPIINYDDYTFSDGYDSYKKNDISRDSALADLAYFSDTFRTDDSSDTLKQLVDQSINEQVPQPAPMVPTTTTGFNDSYVSPISTREGCRCCERASNDPLSEQVEVSSPTASTVSPTSDANQTDEPEAELCRALDSMSVYKEDKPYD